MNNLAFNTTADQLRVSSYGYNQTTGKMEALQLNSSGEMLVSGSVTVTGGVTVLNTELTVTGEVTIANAELTVTGEVTIANAELTVTGEVTIANAELTVTGEVTIANAELTVTGEVTVANSLLTVLVSGNSFTSATDPQAAVSGTATALLVDISQLRTGTVFVDNTGANPITVTLQVSPDGTTYFDNPAYTDVVVAGTTATIMVVTIFGQYSQVSYDAGTGPATFDLYFNGQA